MQVGTSCEMMQTRMRKMDGSGSGRCNGIQDIMQPLSLENQTTFRDELSMLSQTDLEKIKDQVKALDVRTLSSAQTISTTSIKFDVIA